MECDKARDQFSSLSEGELNPREEKIVREHLASCSDCRKELGRFEKTMHWLHSVEEVEVPDGFLSGIYEKMKERKSLSTHGERARWRGFIFPLSMKLPIQAVAMVAIVFLVIYLTKWTPFGTFHLKQVGRKTASLPAEREVGKKIDRAEPTVTGETKLPVASAPTGAEQGGGIEKGLVLKISDREQVIPQIRELVKKFGGEIEKTEGNLLLASLPAVSFTEFEKGMAGLSSSKKEDKLALQKGSAESLRVSPGVKRRELEEKELEKPLSDREGHIIVRILLLQE
jgi:hypothetical protein